MACRTSRLVPNSEMGVHDLVVAHLVFDERLHVLHVVGAGLPLDAGVDVFGVLAERDHVHLGGVLDRGGDAVEVVGRADVRVEVELLAEGDVEAPEAAADGRRERPLDGDVVVLDGLQRVLRRSSRIQTEQDVTGFDQFAAALVQVAHDRGRAPPHPPDKGGPAARDTC